MAHTRTGNLGSRSFYLLPAQLIRDHGIVVRSSSAAHWIWSIIAVDYSEQDGERKYKLVRKLNYTLEMPMYVHELGWKSRLSQEEAQSKILTPFLCNAHVDR